MTILFVDGFDHYATADILKKYTGMGAGAILINPTGGRRGGGAITLGYNGAYVLRGMSVASAFVFGAAVQPTGAGGNAMPLYTLRDGTTTQCELVINADFSLSVRRNGVALGTSTATLVLSAWAFVEWKVTIADAIPSNSCIVRVNGVEVLNLAAGLDTKNSTTTSATQFFIGGSGGGSGVTVLLDDFYLCDQSGTSNNDFLGDIRIDTQLANADGTYNDFTPSSGTAHYDKVAKTVPATATYNASGTVGAKDTYQFGDLASVTGTIKGVQVVTTALKDDAGTRQIANLVRSGGVDTQGASTALSTSPAMVITALGINPATGVAFTEADINALEAGVVITG